MYLNGEYWGVYELREKAGGVVCEGDEISLSINAPVFE
ncbi:CotH kinase family protein [bacterium]|nr:CotH kinase family protein [bacterium]